MPQERISPLRLRQNARSPDVYVHRPSPCQACREGPAREGVRQGTVKTDEGGLPKMSSPDRSWRTGYPDRSRSWVYTSRTPCMPAPLCAEVSPRVQQAAPLRRGVTPCTQPAAPLRRVSPAVHGRHTSAQSLSGCACPDTPLRRVSSAVRAGHTSAQSLLRASRPALLCAECSPRCAWRDTLLYIPSLPSMVPASLPVLLLPAVPGLHRAPTRAVPPCWSAVQRRASRCDGALGSVLREVVGGTLRGACSAQSGHRSSRKRDRTARA